MRRFLSIAAAGGSVVLLFASFLGFAANAFWFFDLFNHFRVQYLAAGILGIVVALGLRAKRLALAFATAALVNAALVVPLFFPQPHAPESVHEISILSSNTWRRNTDWSSVVTAIQEHDPNIAYFTEMHPSFGPRFGEFEADYHIFRRDEGVLLVRRRAGLSPEPVTVPTGVDIAGIPVSLSVEGVTVTLLAVHPAAPISAEAANTRDQQFVAIASFLEKQKGLVIIVGDFNATPLSRAFQELQHRTGLRNSLAGFGIQTTWPSYPGSYFNGLIRIPIDHCLHSPALHTIDRRVLPHRGSNHNPILIRLGIDVRRNRASRDDSVSQSGGP
ncbi:MAG: endonuclease/exonuclease/phosphatase family protein [Verrucomicrobiota bacterium]